MMKARYTPVFLLCAMAMFALSVSVHDLRSVDFTHFSGAIRAHGQILLFGNSINRTVSRCDQDARTLPEMLSALGQPSVVNVSRGGMQLSQMLHVADVVTRLGVRPRVIVFPLFFSDLLQPATAPHGIAAFLADNLPRQASGMPALDTAAYKGVRYGSYGEFSKTYFQREKMSAGCPESWGTDRAFVEFMYWRNFLQPDDPLVGLSSAVERAGALKQRGIAVAFWLVPINTEDLRMFHGTGAVEDVLRRATTLSDALVAKGFVVLDTTGALPASGFADRWCACGHLSQSGRQALAGRLIADFGAISGVDR